jgi:hypothetical protein
MGESTKTCSDLPEFPRGAKVTTTRFYADSPVGSVGTVIRSWRDPKRGFRWVRVNYGRNLSGKSLLKTMSADCLAVIDSQ